MSKERDKSGKPGARRFGIDHSTGRLVLGPLSVPLPKSPAARMGVGVVLICGGVFGFMPVLGFWMLPLGFIVLSHDLPAARRMRRRLSVWWHRKRRPRRDQENRPTAR